MYLEVILQEVGTVVDLLSGRLNTWVYPFLEQRHNKEHLVFTFQKVIVPHGNRETFYVIEVVEELAMWRCILGMERLCTH